MYEILDQPVQYDEPFRYAGFWIRAAAVLLDMIVVSVCFLVFSLIFSALEANANAIYIVSFALLVAYPVVSESSRWQGTIGKLMAGIKVVNKAGEKITLAQSFARRISKVFSALPIGVGFLLAGFDKRKQAIHDRIAGTYVVYQDEV
jgi:uncharacterized RDD family membrane protein YckC